jgi:hypothetical protein
MRSTSGGNCHPILNLSNSLINTNFNAFSAFALLLETNLRTDRFEGRESFHAGPCWCRAGERGYAVITNETVMGDIAVAAAITDERCRGDQYFGANFALDAREGRGRTRAARPGRRRVDLEGEVRTLSAVKASGGRDT